jgi:hypothetical protein
MKNQGTGVARAFAPALVSTALTNISVGVIQLSLKEQG